MASMPCGTLRSAFPRERVGELELAVRLLRSLQQEVVRPRWTEAG
jgi:hypothetical protein